MSLPAIPSCLRLESLQESTIPERISLSRGLNHIRITIAAGTQLAALTSSLRLENPLATHRSDAANKLGFRIDRHKFSITSTHIGFQRDQVLQHSVFPFHMPCLETIAVCGLSPQCTIQLWNKTVNHYQLPIALLFLRQLKNRLNTFLFHQPKVSCFGNSTQPSCEHRTDFPLRR